jgi:hypothetical protein
LGQSSDPVATKPDSKVVEEIATKVAQLKATKDKALKDRILDELEAMGVALHEERGEEVAEKLLNEAYTLAETMTGAPKSTTKPATKETKEADPASGRQVAYQPKSKSGQPVGTLTPVNMAKGAGAALAALEKRVGTVDKFVATKLGYKPDELGRYFSGEQIDALGLAIDNLERGKGFIIGDQTGVGKGRINAAIIRWATKNDKTPIFLTEKPNLYADMIRDLSDIGMSTFKPLVTNNSLQGSDAIPLPNGDTIRTKPTHVQELMHAASVGRLEDRSGESYDAVFTTYNQLQQVNSENTARNTFVERFLPGAVLIMDESHNGGGSGAKQRPNKKKPNQKTRSAILRDYVSRASSVFYSSATYAKRPDSMSLYSKTDMSLASDDPKKLEAAFAKGGVGLQQVAASMLTESGQYLRRERSFEGVEFATKTMPVSRASAENAATGMREIVSFEAEWIAPIIAGMKEENAGAGSASGGDAGEVHSTNFTSIMHNIIDQMLLAMKADAAADEAIASLKAGEKPVVAVANTMGSMIEEIVGHENIKPGQRLDFTFKDVMLRYLERTRWYTEGNAYGKKERKYITDDMLGPEGIAAFKRAQEQIRSLNFGAIPGSPIDHLHARLHAAGYKVGEITGRSATIDYTAPAKGAVYRVRPQAEKSKGSVVKTIERFNGGAANRPVPQDQRLDVLIINQSGATGLSLHASEKFADQRRRRMIIAQAERNIDTFMQMLGRVHRTGQVIPPAYSLATADIPAEKRPAAVLAKKLASLNANTTASAEGDVATGTDDFMNEVGDEVADALMMEDAELWLKLGKPDTRDDEGKPKEGAMRKVTGRIPLLPVAEQEDLYTKLEALYAQAVERKKAMGENVGSAETLDLQARPILRTTIFPGKEGVDSPFAKPAHLAQMSVKRLGKPMTKAEVKAAVEKAAASKSPATRSAELRDELASEFGPFLEQRLSALKEEESRDRQRRVLDGMRNHVERLLQHRIGETVKLSTDDQNFYGVVIGIEKREGLKNPAAPSGWQMKIAVADPVRQLNVPFSSLYAPDQVGKDGVGKGGVIVEPFEGTVDLNDGEPARTVHDLFDHLQSGSREKRFMVTGNVMAGFTALKAKGKIVFYTDDKGQTQAGVLMPKGYKADLTGADTPQVLTDPEHIMQFVTRSDEPVKTGDGELRFMFGRQGFELMAPASKARGGQYFMDKDLIAAAGREFVKAGQMMMVRGLNQIQARAVIQVIQRKFGPLAAWAQQRMARQIAGLPEPEVERFDDKGEPTAPKNKLFTDEAAAKAEATLKQQSRTLNSGINPAAVGAGITLAGHRIERAIRFLSPTPSERMRIKARTEELLDPLRYTLQDSLIYLQRGQERAIERDGPLRISEDARLAAELFPGRTGQRLEEAEERLFRPLIEEVQKSRLSLTQVGDYLYARHAFERNARIRTIDPSNDEGSGMSNADARKIIADFRADGHEPRLKRIAELVDQITESSVQIREDAGLLSPQEAEAWRMAYASYVPLKGVEEDPDGEIAKAQGRGFDVRGKESQAATGRFSKAPSQNILANVLSQYQEAVVRAEKNRVGKRLLLLATQHPDPDSWRIYKPKVKKVIDKATGMVRKQVVNEAWRKPNVVALKVKGEHVFIEFTDERISRGLRGLDNANMNSVVRKLQGLVNIYSSLRTRWNPEFFLGNLPADMQTAMLNVQDQGQKGMAKAIARDVWKAIAGAWKAGKGDTSSEWAKHYLDFAEHGGAVKFFGMKEVAEQRAEIEKALKALGPQPLWKMPARAIMQLERKVFGPFNDATENAVRVAVYVNLVRAGVHKDKAAAAAKNVSTNFNKRGTGTPLLRLGYAFANASVQGNVRMAQAVVKSRKLRYAVGGIILGSIALDVLNGMLSPEDDDGERRYDKIEPWVLDMNMVLMNPWAGPGDAAQQAWKLRMPYGYNVFAVFGRMVGQQIRAAMGIGPDRNPVTQGFHLLSAIFNAFSPVGGAENPLVPTLLLPFWEMASNKNFAGSPIYPQQHFGPAKEDHEQHFDSVLKPVKGVTDFLAEHSRGADNKPMVDVSPETIEHMIDFMGGAAWTFGKRTYNLGHAVATGDLDSIGWGQIPFARRVIEGRNKYHTRGRYYDIRGEIDLAEAQIKAAPPEQRQLIRQRKAPELRAKAAFDSAEKRRKELAKRVRRHEAAGQDDQAKAIDTRIEGMMTEAIAAYNRAVEQTGAVRH